QKVALAVENLGRRGAVDFDLLSTTDRHNFPTTDGQRLRPRLLGVDGINSRVDHHRVGGWTLRESYGGEKSQSRDDGQETAFIHGFVQRQGVPPGVQAKTLVEYSPTVPMSLCALGFSNDAAWRSRNKNCHLASSGILRRSARSAIHP